MTSEQGTDGSLARILDFLGHPFVLLLMTALISGLLIPRLTQQWQEHAQQLQTRKDPAARVFRVVGELFAATQFAQSGRASITQKELNDAYSRWLVESSVLAAELTAYYHDDTLNTDWKRCELVTEAYYAQLGFRDNGFTAASAQRRTQYLQRVAREAGYPPTVDLTNVLTLRGMVIEERDAVIRRVLSAPMP